MQITGIKHTRLLITLTFILIIGIWYFARVPSNDRTWSLDQQVLPYAEFNDNEVRVFNIRNFTYESVATYTPAYYDKTFKLDELETVDYIVEPFDNIGAAHTFLSFGFANGDYLAISVEIRKEIGETFSPIKGLLRSYELMYVIADERDVVALRTNHRKDNVYLYPVTASKEDIRKLFIDMLTRANELREDPEFYNTITNTCTTNIAGHINDIAPNHIPWDIRLLFPKNSDMLAYELGLIGNGVALEELRKEHQINERALEYADSPDFSRLIRE